MKNLRKCRVLAVLLAVLMTLSMFSVLNVSAVAESQQISASQSQSDKLYFKPNSNWLSSNARFAVYLSGGTSGNVWVSMTATEDGYYSADIPSGNYAKVLFCRMKGSTTENTWANSANKSVTMDFPTNGTDCFTLDSGLWNSATGTWGVYTPVEPKAVYFKPNSNWLSSNARFAVYLSGGTSGNVWVSMTATDDGFYTATIPNGDYANILFCRMKGSTTENTWANLANKSVTMAFPADGTDCFTLDSGLWSGATGTWGEYTPVEPKVVYFKPNSNWLSSNARFAVYLSGGTSGNVWVSMTATDDGYYSATIPNGDYANILFCRMKGSTTENTWANLANKSATLAFPADDVDCFTLDSGLWSGATGTWGEYTPVVPKTLYFKPNSNWLSSNARFAFYLSGGASGNVWVSMTANSDGYYTANIPNGDYANILFCRMKGSTTENTWANSANKSVTMAFPADNVDCFTLDSGLWNSATGVWSTYGKVEPTNPTEKPTEAPTEDPTKTTTTADISVKQGDVVNFWVELTLPENGKDLSGWTVEMLFDDEVFDINKSFADGCGFASGNNAVDYALGKSNTPVQLPGGSIVQGNLNMVGKAKFTDANLPGFKFDGKTTKLVCIQLVATKSADTTLEYKYLDLVDVEYGDANYLDKTADKLINGAYSKIKCEIA